MEDRELMQFTCERCGKFVERSLPTMVDTQGLCWDCALKQFYAQASVRDALIEAAPDCPSCGERHLGFCQTPGTGSGGS